MPIPQHIRDLANQAGAEAWVDTLQDWEESLGDDPNSNNWHRTDLRHLGNLASPTHQGLITPETDPLQLRRIHLLADEIGDWVYDHFPEDGDDDAT